MAIISNFKPYSIPTSALILDAQISANLTTSSSSSVDNSIVLYECIAGENIDKNKLIYINSSGLAYLAGTLPAVGVAYNSITAGNTLQFFTFGKITTSSLTAGSTYFLDTNGNFSLYSEKSLVQEVGIAFDSSTLYIYIKNPYILL